MSDAPAKDSAEAKTRGRKAAETRRKKADYVYECRDYGSSFGLVLEAVVKFFVIFGVVGLAIKFGSWLGGA